APIIQRIMRKTAVWAALLGIAAAPFAGSAKDIEPGKARWIIKTSVPDSANLTKAGTLVSLSDFLALAPAAEHASKDFEGALYPKTAGAKVGEGQIVR